MRREVKMDKRNDKIILWQKRLKSFFSANDYFVEDEQPDYFVLNINDELWFVSISANYFFLSPYRQKSSVLSEDSIERKILHEVENAIDDYGKFERIFVDNCYIAFEDEVVVEVWWKEL